MSRYELVVVGTSWGDELRAAAATRVAKDELDAAVTIVQHRGGEHERGLYVDMLQRRTRRPVVEVSDKEPIRPLRVYTAPADYHLLVERGHFSLSTEERVMYARPSIDVGFERAAEAYRERLVGIVLTGANADGAAGLARIKESGGVAIVQDPETAEAPAMPRAAVAATAPDAVLPVPEMGPFLRELVAVPA